MSKPEEYSVLRALDGRALSISEIANKLKWDRASTSFWLGRLEKSGQVDSHYVVIKKPTKAKSGKVKRVYFSVESGPETSNSESDVNGSTSTKAILTSVFKTKALISGHIAQVAAR